VVNALDEEWVLVLASPVNSNQTSSIPMLTTGVVNIGLRTWSEFANCSNMASDNQAVALEIQWDLVSTIEKKNWSERKCSILHASACQNSKWAD